MLEALVVAAIGKALIIIVILAILVVVGLVTVIRKVL